MHRPPFQLVFIPNIHDLSGQQAGRGRKIRAALRILLSRSFMAFNVDAQDSVRYSTVDAMVMERG